MSAKFKLRKDTDQVRLVALVVTAIAALFNTIQVLYPFVNDPYGWGAQAGLGNTLLFTVIVVDVLLTLVQFARWDLSKLRVVLRWGGVFISGAWLILVNLFVLTVPAEELLVGTGITDIGYIYNYTMLEWQVVNTWVLPMFAVGVYHESKLDRWLLVVFASLGTVYAALNAWFTYQSVGHYRPVPAMLGHWIGYVLPPVLFGLTVLCAVLIGIERKKRTP